MIFLLDLNYTLVEATYGGPFNATQTTLERISTENYRTWLVELLRESFVVLITARPNNWEAFTLKRIREQCRWEPDMAIFNYTRLPAPAFKKFAMLKILYPMMHSESRFFAIESNPATRAMYAKLGIRSTYVREKPWATLDEMTKSAV